MTLLTHYTSHWRIVWRYWRITSHTDALHDVIDALHVTLTQYMTLLTHYTALTHTITLTHCMTLVMYYTTHWPATGHCIATLRLMMHFMRILAFCELLWRSIVWLKLYCCSIVRSPPDLYHHFRTSCTFLEISDFELPSEIRFDKFGRLARSAVVVKIQAATNCATNSDGNRGPCQVAVWAKWLEEWPLLLPFEVAGHVCFLDTQEIFPPDALMLLLIWWKYK